MSHWQEGKISTKCSLGILREALINLVPEWEEYISIDKNSSLSIYNSYLIN
jgi:hypothetical protein